MAPPGAGTLRVRNPLLWREGFCEQVVVVVGRCPQAAGEVMLHRNTAQRLKAQLGQELQASFQGLDDRFSSFGSSLLHESFDSLAYIVSLKEVLRHDFSCSAYVQNAGPIQAHIR